MIYRTLSDEIIRACVEGDLELIREKAGTEFDVNDRDSTRLPLLCHAIRSGRLDMVKWLVENGADVNISLQSPVDFGESESLLVWCTDRMECHSEEIKRYLIEKGAVKKY